MKIGKVVFFRGNNIQLGKYKVELIWGNNNTWVWLSINFRPNPSWKAYIKLQKEAQGI